MGQNEVVYFLSLHPNEWLSSKQSAEMMNTDPNNVCIILRKLRRWDHIFFKPKVQTRKDMSRYVYKYKKQ